MKSGKRTNDYREQAQEGIFDLLANGDLELNENLSERLIAEKTGFSRTPIRQSLAVLFEQGVVEQKPQVGFSIKRIMADEMAELVTVSQVIETMAIDNLGSIAEAEIVEKLDEVLGNLVQLPRLAKADDRKSQDAFLKTEVAFHERLTAAGMIGNSGPKLVALWGLKRRLFHIEHPLEVSVMKSITTSDVELVDALLQSRHEDAQTILNEYYKDQMFFTKPDELL